MITYEVNVQINQALEPVFMRWLKDHVRRIVALEGFIDATIEPLKEDEQLLPGKSGFCVRYRLMNQQALEGYLEVYAPALRADGVEQFGDKLSIYRRVLGGTLFSVRH